MNSSKNQIEILVTVYGEKLRDFIPSDCDKWIYDFLNCFNPSNKDVKQLSKLILYFRGKGHFNSKEIYSNIENFSDLYVLYSKYFSPLFFKENLKFITKDLEFKNKLNLLNESELFILYVCAGLFNVDINQILEFGWLLEITNWSIRSLILKIQDPENLHIRQNLSPLAINQNDSPTIYDHLLRNNFKEREHLFTIPQSSHLTDINLDIDELQKSKIDSNKSEAQYIIYSFYLQDLYEHVNNIKPNPKDTIYVGHPFNQVKSLNGFLPDTYLNSTNQIYTNNIGRDWGGFLQIFNQITSLNEISFISHVKKSPYHSNIYAKKWIQEIAAPIKLNKDGLVTQYMLNNKNTGIIASKKHKDFGIGKNFTIYHKLCNILEIPIKFREINYLAGSFFVIRSFIIKDFFDKLNIQIFSNDLDDCFDSTFAHACERAIFAYVRSKNFKIAWI